MIELMLLLLIKVWPGESIMWCLSRGFFCWWALSTVVCWLMDSLIALLISNLTNIWDAISKRKMYILVISNKGCWRKFNYFLFYLSIVAAKFIIFKATCTTWLFEICCFEKNKCMANWNNTNDIEVWLDK